MEKRIEIKTPGILIDELTTVKIKQYLHHDKDTDNDDIAVIVSELNDKEGKLSDAIRRQIGHASDAINRLIENDIKCFFAQEKLFECYKKNDKVGAGEAAIEIHRLNAQRNRSLREVDSTLGFSEITLTGKTYGRKDMKKNKIACSHPGKFGDILYSVGPAKWLANEIHGGAFVDFYISSYYGALDKLFGFQSWMNPVIPPGYRIDHHGWGAQPWDMSEFIPEDEYDAVYQFGFRNYPYDQVSRFYLSEVGFPGVMPNLTGVFEYPELEFDFLDGIDRYVVMAPRGDKDFYKSFYDFMDKCPIPVVQTGAPSEYFEHDNAINATGRDWLDTVSLYSGAEAFFGLISSQGALAHNFDFPKAFIYHQGWGASIGQLPLTPTTHRFLQEQGGMIAGEFILEKIIP